MIRLQDWSEIYMTRRECNIILFSITLCWASSYIFIKDLPENFSSFAYLTMTAGIAGLILLLVFHRAIKGIDKKTLFRALILAALIAGNMLLEKAGLNYIPSSTASFLASLNIVIVPLIMLILKKFPTRNNVAGIFVIMAGLLVSNGISISEGSITGLLCMLGACFLMSLYTVMAADFTKKSNPLVLSVLQICFSAVFGFVLWCVEDPATFIHIEWSKRMLSSIFILAFFSKAYAYIMLMYAEKYADAISVTIIASTEPVVTLTLALIIPNAQGATESFSLRTLIGALVIALGAVVAGSDFLSPKNNEKTDETTEIIEERKKVQGVENKERKERTGELSGYTEKDRGRIGIRLKQILLTMVPFAILGAAFKVMVLIEGLTEVRPANAIPMVSGYLFGPFGALGCALGNLIADCFGTLNMTSLLGVVGNFMAAYIPYRIWHAVSKDKPNVHTCKNILIYIWSAYVGALVCAWILGFGLELFFSLWIDTIYKYVFLNNFGFSVALGLPVFILATSDSIHLEIHEPKITKNPLSLKAGRWLLPVLVILTIMLTGNLIGVYMGYHLSTNPIMGIMSIITVVCLICMFILPVKKEGMINE